MQFDEVLRTWKEFFEREGIIHLLGLPGVDRQFIRDYFERKGLLDVFDEIEKRT